MFYVLLCSLTTENVLITSILHIVLYSYVKVLDVFIADAFTINQCFTCNKEFTFSFQGKKYLNNDLVIKPFKDGATTRLCLPGLLALVCAQIKFNTPECKFAFSRDADSRTCNFTKSKLSQESYVFLDNII